MGIGYISIIVVTIFIISFGLFSNSPEAFAASYASVSIPSGTSVPGCEQTNACFIPATVTIDEGGEVTWSNDDSAAHTVTSGAGIPDGNFDSSLFMAGTTFSVVFDDAGTYPYFCMVHPWMTGEVTVKEVLVAPPPPPPSDTDVTIQFGSSAPSGPKHFSPSYLSIDEFETVKWYNADSAAHTVTSGTPSVGPDGNFDSSLITPGSAFSHTFTSSGSYDYFCILHPWMTAEIDVKSTAPPPTPVPTPTPTPYGTDVTIPSGTSVPGCENTNSCFLPSTISVSSGDSITWFNADSAAHTVTSGTPGGGPDGNFDSSLFMAGTTFSVTLYNKGTYPYVCMVHPWMVGTVIVSSGSSSPSPTPSGPPITVSTEKSSYKAGDYIRIVGEVSEKLSGFPVTTQVISPNGNIVTLMQLEVGKFNKFSKTLVDTDGSLWRSSGTYTVKVLYGTESRTAESTFYFDAPGSSVPTPIPIPAPKPVPIGDITIPSGTSVPGCELTNSCYIPSTLRVSPGDSVTWYNDDSAAHTVTSGTAAVGPDGNFDSSLFMAGTTFSVTFRDSGTFPYFCLVHPWMVGEVIVGSGGTSGSLSMEISQKVYKPGDLAEITAVVSGSQSANVAVSVTSPTGDNIVSRTITTDRNGIGDLQFKLPDSAQTGSYQVIGTSSISGSTLKDSTQFTVKSMAGRVSIVSLDPTDQQGNLVSSFSKGKLAFAKVVLSSGSNVSMLVTVNLFDSDLTSLGIGSFKTTLSPGQSEMTISFFIPNDAVSGSGNVYANVFSDWPSNGGTPLTGESSTSVRIQ